MVTVTSNIKKIRETVLGKDMRELIADSCEKLQTAYQNGKEKIVRVTDFSVTQTSQEDEYMIVFT